MDTRFRNLVITSIVLVVAYAAVAESRAPQRAAEDIGNASRTAWKASLDVVFAGDSRTHDGISPDDVREILPGARIGNYGWSAMGWSPRAIERTVETLDPGGKRVLVIGVSPHAFTERSATQNSFLDTDKSHPVDKWAMRTLRPAANATAPWGPTAWLRRLNPELGLQSFVIHENGWFEALPKSMDGGRILKAHADRLRQSPHDPKKVDELCEQLKAVVQSGVRVVAFRPPVSDEMREVEATIGHYDEGAVRRALESAGVLYIEVPGTYETFDGSHMASPIAKRFSREIAQILARDLNL